MSTAWGAEGSPEGAAATQLLELSIAQLYHDRTADWIRAGAGETAEWRQAARFGDRLLHLTAAELTELGGKIDELLRPYQVRHADPGLRPPDSRPVTVLDIAFPSPPDAPADQDS